MCVCVKRYINGKNLICLSVCALYTRILQMQVSTCNNNEKKIYIFSYVREIKRHMQCCFCCCCCCFFDVTMKFFSHQHATLYVRFDPIQIDRSSVIVVVVIVVILLFYAERVRASEPNMPKIIHMNKLHIMDAYRAQPRVS